MNYSFTAAVGTGAPQTIAVPSYISKDHIKVTVAGTPSTTFSWINASTISLTAPAGARILVLRQTSPDVRLVSYSDGAQLPGALLDLDSKQAFMLSQEAADKASSGLRAPDGMVFPPLPGTPEEWANKALTFDSNGNPVCTVPAEGTATALATDLLNKAQPNSGAGMVAYGGPALNYVAGTIGYAVSQEVQVTSFVVGGQYVDKTGVVNAAPFFQAAVAFAELLIATNNAYNELSVAIRVPYGKYNFAGSTVSWSKNGISFVGPPGRGATIIGSGTAPLFAIGDQTNTWRTRKASLINLQLITLNTSNTVAAVTLYRTATANILENTFVNWYIGLDCTRAATTQIRGNWFDNPNRTTSGLAAIRMQGTDETGFASPTNYSPGGGFHIVDNEFSGSSPTVDTTYGLMVRAVDGLYMANNHLVGYEMSVGLVPEGTAESRVVIDVNAINNYFDEPSTFAASPKCFAIAGTVKETISAAVGTVTSTYRSIRLTNNQIRGNFEATYCLYMAVADGDSWWDNATTSLEDIIISGNTLRQSTVRGLYVVGAGSGAFVEPRNLIVANNVFDDNNYSGSTGGASDISIQAENVSITGNTFGPFKTAGADYIILVSSLDAGATDGPNPGVLIANNNLSRCTAPAIDYIRITQTETGSNTLEANNLLPGAGKYVNQTYKRTTADAAATPVWTYVIPEGTSGTAEVALSGSSADGSKVVTYSWRVGFRRNSVGSTLSSGTSSWTAVTAWNPDGFATVPVADLSTNTLRVVATGIAATTINWVLHVRLNLSR
jgi:hypothetical protein